MSDNRAHQPAYEPQHSAEQVTQEDAHDLAEHESVPPDDADRIEEQVEDPFAPGGYLEENAATSLDQPSEDVS